MLAIIGGGLFIFGLYLLYVAVSFLRISSSEYEEYKKRLSGLINTIKGENSIDIAGAVHGDGRDKHTGKLHLKSSYSPEHTKSLIDSSSK